MYIHDKKEKSLRGRWIALIVIASLIIGLSLLKLIPWVSETVFARGFSRVWIFLFGNVSSLFPFSLFEIFILLAIAYSLYCVVKWIVCVCKKNKHAFLRSFSLFCLIISSVLLVYTSVASISYKRDALPVVSYYNGSILTTEQTKEYAEWYKNEINSLSLQFERNPDGTIISPYTFNEVAELLKKEYSRIDDSYLSSYTPKAKKTFLDFMWKDFFIKGITFAPTGEALVLDKMPILDVVETMGHELAHTKGVMRENDASLLSYYIMFTSNNDFLRYCGYVWMLGEVFWLLSIDSDLADYYSNYGDNIDRNIYADFYLSFWDGYSGVFGRVSTFFNDLYLKLTGNKKGTDSYGDFGGDFASTPDPDDKNGAEIITIIEYSLIQKMILFDYFTQ